MAVRSRDPALNIISLCTGGGGLDLGLELAVPCARPVCYVEREAFAVASLVEAMRDGRMADAPVWSDVTTFRGRGWRGRVDGVIGGIPCQPHSYAGQRKGATDDRDLWPDARRIINASRPWLVWIENVAGMLVGPEGQIAGAARVRRDLAGMSFRSEIVLVRAAEIGTSQERARVFILGLADDQSFGRREGRAEFSGRFGQPASVLNDNDLEHAERTRRSPPGSGPALDSGAQPESGSSHMAHASSERGALGVSGSERPAEEGIAGEPEHDGDALGDTPSAGQLPAAQRSIRGGEEGVGSRHAEPQRRSGPLVHAGRTERRSIDAVTRDIQGPQPGRIEIASGLGESDAPMADADFAELRRQSSARQFGLDESHAGPGLFPPGPGERDAWAEIGTATPDLLPALSRHDRFRIALGNARHAAESDPARRTWLDPSGPYGLRASIVQEIAQSGVRRMADGMVSRVDQLRLLGNGVVPLQAAYAFRLSVDAHASFGATAAADALRDLMQ